MNTWSFLLVAGSLVHLSVDVHKVSGQSVRSKRNSSIVVETLWRHGYPAETHSVVTEDGYELTLHRIPRPSKPPVLLNHGILQSAYDFLVLGPEKSLGYILSDAGYDVWLGNVRGNAYSRKHKWLNDTDFAFWQFTFHEIGVYDVPAQVDYVLANTRREQLTYVGYSLGATQFFVMTSQRPEYNHKIKQMHALAPAVFLGRNPTFFSQHRTFNDNLMSTLNVMFAGEFIAAELMKQFLDFQCGVKPTKQCVNYYTADFGGNLGAVNVFLIPLIKTYFPSGGASTKTIHHFMQLFNTGKFRQFDYGTSKNELRYNSPDPPEYDLSKVSVPVFIQHAARDTFGGQANIERLCSKLSSCSENRLVPDRKFVHFDFAYGEGARELVYDHIVSCMERAATY